MASPRYLTAHVLMPRFLREQGAPAVLDAIERSDLSFFIHVWMHAGFRFSPRFLHALHGEYRVGVMTLPMPREETEAYFAAVVGKPADSRYVRYFLLELADSIPGPRRDTIIGEWTESVHANYGAGPPFTGNLDTDRAAFIDRLFALCG